MDVKSLSFIFYVFYKLFNIHIVKIIQALLFIVFIHVSAIAPKVRGKGVLFSKVFIFCIENSKSLNFEVFI